MYGVHAYRPDGTYDLTIHEHQSLDEVSEFARKQVDSGEAIRCEVVGDKHQVVYFYPRLPTR